MRIPQWTKTSHHWRCPIIPQSNVSKPPTNQKSIQWLVQLPNADITDGSYIEPPPGLALQRVVPGSTPIDGITEPQPEMSQEVPVTIQKPIELIRFKIGQPFGSKESMDAVSKTISEQNRMPVKQLSFDRIVESGQADVAIAIFETPVTDHRQRMLWDITRSLTTLPRDRAAPQLSFTDSSIFSTCLIDELSHNSTRSPSATLAPRGSLFPTGRFQIGYRGDHPHKEFCEEQFKVDFKFDGDAVHMIAHVWNFSCKPSYQHQLDHFTVTIEERILRRVVVGLPLKEGNVQLLLELSHPATIKEKHENVQFIQANNADIYRLPDIRARAIYRGMGNQERPGDDVFQEKQILLNLKLDRKELYELLSRLRQKTNVEIGYFQVGLDIIRWGSSPYLRWMGGDRDPFGNAYYVAKLVENFPIYQAESYKQRLILTFRLKYLLAQGSHLKDELRERDTYNYVVENVIKMAVDNFNGCMLLLESIIRFYATATRPLRIQTVFQLFREKLQRMQLVNPYEGIRRDYDISRKETYIQLVISPNGVECRLPEVRFGNMVSRQLRQEEKLPMIRASLRNESGQALRWTVNGVTKEGDRRLDYGLRRMIKGIMVRGISIAGETYSLYGASGSQQREEGMFLMHVEDRDDIYRATGDFGGIPNPNKRFAREGQTTSQSMECSIPITQDMWRVEEDISYDDCRDSNGNMYKFTDGSERISRVLMEEICKSMKIGGYLPSGFQFRFMGAKGMLWIDDRLNRRQIVFRKSQWKFNPGQRPYNLIQVIKFTGPQTTNLSANYLNIIDQNAEIQGEGQDRIWECALAMNEKALNDLFECMVDEARFRQMFTKLPYFLDITKMREPIHQDPLIRDLGRAKILKDLSYLIFKNRLPVDPDYDRSAFGGPDDLGIISPECVYFEATRNVNSTKGGNPQDETVIYEGWGMIGKYPCCHMGDLRRVLFVDCPDYHGMRDKLIFSVKGDRPLADKMSGSDYDGDEFVVTMIPGLMPVRNEEPMDYSPPKSAQPPPTVNDLNQEDWRADTYLNCVQHNNLGLASVCQVVKSDEYGQQSQVALSLTKTTSLNLDMPKTGHLPPDIRRGWTEDEDGNPLPPEFPYRRPDFRPCASKGPTFCSIRLNGILSRLNRQLTFIISMAREKQEIKIDPVIAEIYAKYERRDADDVRHSREGVMGELIAYNQKLESIMAMAKVSSEAELFSNCHFTGKGFDKEEEEEFGNTTHLRMAIDHFAAYRKKLFNTFHRDGYMVITRCEGLYDDEDIIKRTVITQMCTDQMKKMAVICYMACYELARESGKQLLTFGRLGYDILGFAQECFNQNCPDFDVPEESIYNILKDKMRTMQVDKLEFQAIRQYVLDEDNLRNWLDQIVPDCIETFHSVNFALVQLAFNCGVLDSRKTGFKEDLTRFIRIVLYLGLGKLPGFDAVFVPKFNIGRCLLSLISALASRRIFLLEQHDIATHEQITQIYEAIRKTYYYLILSQNMDVFDGDLPYLTICEREPRVIELPEDTDLAEVESVLKRRIGAEELILKQKDQHNRNRVTVLYRGTCETEEALRRLVEIPPLQSPTSKEEEDLYYSTNVHANIMDHR